MLKLKFCVYFLFIAITTFNTNLFGQAKITLNGIVISQKEEKPIVFANILCKEVNRWTTSDENGLFKVDNLKKGKYRIQISYIGYKSLDTTIYISNNKPIKFTLTEDNIALEEIVVIATESKSDGSGSVIKKHALTHLQPTSFADIIELLPGGLSGSKNLSQMKLINFREAGGASKSDYTSSLGTSFVVDDMPLSNDAELQTVSGSYDSDKLSINQRNTTGKGIDMRTISTDDIESVEVIRGIPSVKYGDLTSGVVNIKRSYKKTPLKFRLKSDHSSKLFAAGKGFRINKSEFINMNLDYIKYRPDPRNISSKYSRFTSSLRYKRENSDISNPYRIMVNFDYTGSFDKQKVDPQIGYPETDKYDNSYNKFILNTTGRLTTNSIKWIDNINYRISSSYTHNKKEVTRLTSAGRNIPMPLNYDTGIQDGVFLPSSYISHLIVDGKPVYVNASLSGNLSFFIFNIKQSVYLGGEWRYNKNFGDGQVYDKLRPPYPTTRVRPRKSSDIPSSQKLSFFVEDRFTARIGSNRLKVSAGLRATTPLNLSDNYLMRGKFYINPRINASWKFPALSIAKNELKTSLNIGYGVHTKFPTISHLYPNMHFTDIIQLNYYSQNENLSRLNFITYATDPTSYNLKPAKNTKYEIGFTLKYKRSRLDVTVFSEKMESGFKRLTQYKTREYTDYDESSVPSSGLTGPPDLSMFSSETKRVFDTYSQWINAGVVNKTGIEYQLDLGKIEQIYSRVSINGAWFKTEYDQSLPEYRGASTVIDGKPYPYIGLYNWDKGETYEQFNTNLRFDTHIPSLRLIFSSMIQTVWYTSRVYNEHNGMPDYYIDVNNNIVKYNITDTTDPILRHLYEKPYDNKFLPDKKALAMDLNLKVTKEIGKNMKFAFYVNRILHYYPEYRQNGGNIVKRRTTPSFGMELNIKL